MAYEVKFVIIQLRQKTYKGLLEEQIFSQKRDMYKITSKTGKFI
jgi:hypothetical protein